MQIKERATSCRLALTLNDCDRESLFSRNSGVSNITSYPDAQITFFSRVKNHLKDYDGEIVESSHPKI